MTEITDHLADIVERVAHATERAGRRPGSVTIIAVSKSQSIDAIVAAYRHGLRHFAESYVQEAVPKMTALAGLDIAWHFIGKLQANKTRAVAERFQWVHTLDRAKIAERLNEQRPRFAQPLNVLIQVNQAGEAQKGGVAEHEVAELAREVSALPHLTLRGLMTLPPHGSERKSALFAALAALRDRLAAAEGIELDTLSMGMSDDFEAAIAAGATFVRIGTALFGARASAAKA